MISDLSLSVEKGSILEGDELFAFAYRVGGSKDSVKYPLIKAFDSNKNRENEASVYISDLALEDNPKGIRLEFEKIRKVYEITIVPREGYNKWELVDTKYE